MNRKGIFERAMLWFCGVAVGTLYTGYRAYPLQEVMITGVDPPWVDPVQGLLTAALIGAVLAIIGFGYEQYREVNNAG